jgi:hypothetical protein
MPLENSNPDKVSAKAFVEGLFRPLRQVIGSSGQSLEFKDTFDKHNALQELVNNISARGAVKKMSEEDAENHLKESVKSDHRQQDQATIDNKITAAWQELILKQKQIKDLLDEIEKEDERMRKKASNDIGKTHGSIAGNVEEVENENQNAIKYRILASLIVFGVLDILDLVAEIAGNFGEVGEKFYEGVKKVVTNPNCMSFLADVNQALKLDVVAEGIARTPIFADLNQLTVDVFTSEYLGSLTSLGFDAIQGDLADYLLRFAVLACVINGEVDLNKKFDDVREKIKDVHEKCRINIKEEYEKYEITTAENIIAKETENELKIVYSDAGKRCIKDSNFAITEDLKADLRVIEIKDNSSTTNALDFLQKNDLSKINKYLTDNVEDGQRLASIAMKHRELFKNDAETINKRKELLTKSLGGLELITIKNGLMRMGNNKAKEIGEAIEIEKDHGDEIYNAKDRIIKEMGNKDGDEVIKALALLAQRDEKIALIKGGNNRAEETKGVDLVAPGSALSPSKDHQRQAATHTASGQNFGTHLSSPPAVISSNNLQPIPQPIRAH